MTEQEDDLIMQSKGHFPIIYELRGKPCESVTRRTRFGDIDLQSPEIKSLYVPAEVQLSEVLF